MKIITWNVGVGNEGMWPFEEITHVLNEGKYDIICIQEWRNDLSNLKKCLDNYDLYECDRDGHTQIVCGINKDFKNTKLLKVETFVLEDEGIRFGLGFNISSNNIDFSLINVHVSQQGDHNKQKRHEQFKILGEQKRVILCGDFNYSFRQLGNIPKSSPIANFNFKGVSSCPSKCTHASGHKNGYAWMDCIGVLMGKDSKIEGPINRVIAGRPLREADVKKNPSVFNRHYNVSHHRPVYSVVDLSIFAKNIDQSQITDIDD